MAHCDESVSIGEDLLATFSCFLYVERVYVTADFCPYHYRINESSMIQRYSDKKYEKLDALRAALLRAAAASSVDFTQQIDQDYLGLLLVQLECEILFSGKGKRELKQSLKARYHNEIEPLLRDGKRSVAFSKKQKLYFFLLRHRFYGAMIAIRRAKR